jgi:hypothetical protein
MVTQDSIHRRILAVLGGNLRPGEVEVVVHQEHPENGGKRYLLRRRAQPAFLDHRGGAEGLRYHLGGPHPRLRAQRPEEQW